MFYKIMNLTPSLVTGAPKIGIIPERQHVGQSLFHYIIVHAPQSGQYIENEPW